MKQLPDDFIRQMRSLLGDDADAFLQAASQDDASVSIRLNRRKAAPLSFVETTPVTWCPQGYYLSERPSFTLDPLFHAGAYYVQEASSMFLWTAVQQTLRVMEAENRPLKVLDLCAAPGGKSTLLLDVLPEGSVLVANEIVHSRANILAENLTKWGYPHVIVTEAKPEDLCGTYDLILTDVPCSGEGMFRKDDQAVEHWNLGNVEMCAARQREILQAVWPRLRPGGCLIYSTCTFNTAENEENIAWIASHLGADVLSVDTEKLLGKSFDDLGITPSLKGDLPSARFMFHRSRGEGLFMALLQKFSDHEAAASRQAKLSVKTCKMPEPAQRMLQSSDDFVCVEVAGRYHAMSAEVLSLYDGLAKSKVRMHQAGIALGEIKGKDFIPDAALALSLALKQDAVSLASVDKERALSYLRREAIVLDANVPRGYAILQYEGQNLGWIKNLGNRANNLYPNEWRIRKL
nr:rRNA cytosine-C5-methyltransferase [Bacteroidales bacterium]